VKVLQLISSAGLYGAERVILNLSAGLVASGCQVTIGTLETESQGSRQLSAAARAHGFSVKPIPCRSKIDFAAVRQLRKFVEENGIEVVHTHGYKADLYAYAARRGRATLVATIHSREPFHRAVRLYTKLDGWVLRRFDRLVTVTPQLRDRLLAEGLSGERVNYIPNGVPIPEMRAAGVQDAPVIGVIGRLSYEKGPDLAVQVFDLLNQRGVKFQGVFFGDGPMMGELRTDAERFGLENMVHFPGREVDVTERLAEFAAVLIPSRSEQMPMTLLEAMAAGRPVVAAGVGSIATIVDNAVNGFVVKAGNVNEMANALQRVLQNPEEAAKIGEEARAAVVERYSADAMVSGYVQVYKGSSTARPQRLQSIRTEEVQSNG